MSTYTETIIGTTVTASISPPTGSIMAYLLGSDPDGWVIADGGYHPVSGATITRSNTNGKYNRLINAGIGTGTLNSDNYTPPNYKGAFLRGIGTSNINSNYVGPSSLGSYHNSQISDHSHRVSDPGHSHGVNDPGHSHLMYVNLNNGYIAEAGGSGNRFPGAANSVNNLNGYGTNGNYTGVTINSANTGVSVGGVNSGNYGSEVRPFNYGVNWIIKL